MSRPPKYLVCPDEVCRPFSEQERWDYKHKVFRRYDTVYCLGQRATVLDGTYAAGWGYVKVLLQGVRREVMVSVRDCSVPEYASIVHDEFLRFIEGNS